MQCKKCGAKIADNTELCPKCGAIADTGEMPVGADEDYFSDDAAGSDNEIPSADTETVVSNTSEENDVATNAENTSDNIKEQNEQNRQNQIEKAELDKKAQLEEIAGRRNAKKRRQRRNHIITVSILVVLLIAAAGTAVYLTREGFDENTPTVIETPAPTEEPASDPFASEEPTLDSLTSETPNAEESPSPDTEPDSETSSGSGTPSGGTSAGSSSGGTSSGSSSRVRTSGGSSSSTSSGRTSSGSALSGGTSSSASSGGASSSAASSNSGASADTQTGSYVPQAVVSSGYENTQAKLIYGKRVDYMKSGGDPIFVFSLGNSTCYAYVSYGSTTQDVENKYFLATMTPTDAVYFGEPVYKIVHMTDMHAPGYLIPESSIRIIGDSDIAGFSKEQIAYARNEIYARHGRNFSEYRYSSFFEGKTWYSVNPLYDYSDENSNLSSIERSNVAFLLSKETE